MEKYKRLYQFSMALKWNVELEEKVFVLTVEQVQPAVKLLLVLHFVASLVFIIEVNFFMKWFYSVIIKIYFFR